MWFFSFLEIYACITSFQSNPRDSPSIDEDELLSLIEHLNGKVEREYIEEKGSILKHILLIISHNQTDSITMTKVQERLGHDSIQITSDIYAHISKNMVMKSLSKYEEFAKENLQ